MRRLDMDMAPAVVPEPVKMDFDGEWLPFDGFSNFPEFLSREFGLPRGGWKLVRVDGEGTGAKGRGRGSAGVGR